MQLAGAAAPALETAMTCEHLQQTTHVLAALLAASLLINMAGAALWMWRLSRQPETP